MQDDILLVAPTLEACKNRREELLQFLQEAGYKFSQKKAQICLEEVICLGYHLSQGKRRLGTGRKEVILQYLPRVLETAPGVSGSHRLLQSMDPWILGHCWATLCSTKGEPHRTAALGP
jgi:hypothetical protein